MDTETAPALEEPIGADTGAEAPDPAGQVADAPAPEQGGTGEKASFHDVKLDELSEEVQPFARAVEARMTAGFTRKTQELASARKEAEAALELERALADDSTRQQALAELLGRYGYELPPDEGEYESEGTAEGMDPYEIELAELRARQDQIDERAQLESEQRAEAVLRNHVEQALSEYAQKRGTDLSEAERELVLAQAARVGFDPDTGLPNMEAALAEHEAHIAELEKAAVERYLASKNVRSPGLGGGVGEPATEGPMDQRSRIDRALRVAGRHLA